jgi:glutamyl-tRNA synthetase
MATIKKPQEKQGKKKTKTPEVTRFPPEPSGYPHSGHLKAIFTNLKEAEKTGGSTILRFDDTNPDTSKQEYVNSILTSLDKYGLLEQFSNGSKPSYASDYFSDMIDIALILIKQGDAYIDMSTSEEIKAQRYDLKPSPYQDTDPTVNTEKWSEFMAGKMPNAVVRFKIKFDAPNANLRDPIIYRYSNTPHFRTGTRFCVYPTYDFACPVADSLDGVTLALRTKEFTEKNDVCKWFFKKLNGVLRPVIYRTYARFVLEYSILSKRKIRNLIETGHVDGWDDPRLDTLTAELRKGILPEAWATYFNKHGSSNSDGIEKWDKVYKFNRTIIDSKALRVMALSQNNWQLFINKLSPDEKNVQITVPWSPKDKDGKQLGMKQINLSDDLVIDEADAKPLKVGDLVYLLNFRAVKVTKINIDTKIVEVEPHDDPFEFKDIPWKISWLTRQEVTTASPVKTVYYDYIITKPSVTKDDDLLDYLTKESKKQLCLNLSHNQSALKPGMIVQLLRFGFYIVDSIEPLTLIYIKEPGYLMDNPTKSYQYLLANNLPIASS